MYPRSNVATLDADFERIGAHWAKRDGAIRGIAVVAAPFPVRVLGTMLNRATDALLRHGVPLAFFDTSEEGRAYLEAERARHAALR